MVGFCKSSYNCVELLKISAHAYIDRSRNAPYNLWALALNYTASHTHPATGKGLATQNE